MQPRRPAGLRRGSEWHHEEAAKEMPARSAATAPPQDYAEAVSGTVRQLPRRCLRAVQPRRGQDYAEAVKRAAGIFLEKF